MIDRKAKYALLRLAGQFPIVGVTGPRQSGKTTLTKAVFPDKKYVTFDDQEIRSLAKSNPKDFLMAFPDGLIIDEAQKIPEIFDALKFQVDNNEFVPGKYILTGSSQFKLRKNMSDSLSGRAAFLTLLPFTADELKDADVLPESAYDFIYRGQYPPLYDSEKNYIKEDWYENYIDTYLERDVEDKINTGNIATFRRFLQICAVHSGKILSMDSIARDVGVSAPTVKSWLSILESSYIIHFLETDTNNLGKSVIKSPKLYFVDSGLLCHLLRMESKEDLLLDRMKGAVVETYAVSEMLKCRTNQAKKPYLTYFRDKKGFEVDMIADWKHTYAIEVKSSSDAEDKLSANIRKYVDIRDDGTKGAVFYLGDITVSINGIDYVGWKDWDSFLLDS